MSAPPTLLYVVTEDWYFWLHRLALGRGALAAGYRVVVAARVQDHRQRIEDAGFELVALPWRRRGGRIVDELRTLVVLWRLMRRERPAVVHLIALKAIIYGGLVARLARMRRRVSTIAGLGFVFTARHWKARLLRTPVVAALRLAMGGGGSVVTLENPDDGHVLAADGGLNPARVAAVCCCGVDVAAFAASPEPAGMVTVGMACRLVRDKGAGVAVEAMRRLREEGVAVRFVLAGGVDPGSPDSFSAAEVEGWVAEGLVEWLGHIDDVAAFWRGCHIALYPSRYGEGVPKTLLEAAACARPSITTDSPGCREAVRDGENGLLVPIDDPAALAAAIRRLAEDGELRRRLGAAGRARAETEFADPVVVATLLATYRS